jgi:hypothetical protein
VADGYSLLLLVPAQHPEYVEGSLRVLLRAEDGDQHDDHDDELRWVYVDLDAALAQGIWTLNNPAREIGEPISDNVGQAHELAEHGYKIVINTPRPWSDREAIEQWLLRHGISSKAMQRGRLPDKVGDADE